MEDLHHEFKGHRCLSVNELSPYSFHDTDSRTKRTKRAVSRAINSFLNSGEGGTVYLGIQDDGRAVGLPLSGFQMDHVVVSLKDLLERQYRPAVQPDQYKINFIPVLPEGINSLEEMFDKRQVCTL